MLIDADSYASHASASVQPQFFRMVFVGKITAYRSGDGDAAMGIPMSVVIPMAVVMGMRTETPMREGLNTHASEEREIIYKDMIILFQSKKTVHMQIPT